MENTKFMSLTGKIAGTMAVASIGSFAVALNADAASLLFQDTASFSNEKTELTGMPELIVEKYVPPANVTITEVQIMYSASLMSSGTITNNAAQTQSFTILSVVNQFDLVPDQNPPETLSPFAPFTTIGSQSYTLAAGESAPFGPFTLNSPMLTESYTGGDIASFIGPGDVTFSPFTNIFTIIQGGGGNIATDIETFADATVQIKYFGEVIPPPPTTPEPSAMAGFAVLAGLGFMTKKRASKKS